MSDGKPEPLEGPCGESTDPGESRTFVATFAAIVSLGLAALVAFTVAVDPRADFGTGWLPPLVVAHRDLRVRGLATPFGPPPGIVVLGSSRAWKVEPPEVEKRFGAPAFVAAVDDARAEDHLALARHLLLDRKPPPRLLLLQLDPPVFHPTLAASTQLLRHPVLSRHLPADIPVADHLARWLDAPSLPVLTEGLRSLRLAATGYPTPDVRVGPDGFVSYQLRERELAEGRFDLDHHIDETIHHFRRIYAGFDRLSARRLAYLDALLELAAAKGTRVAIWIPPVHPHFEAALAALPAYPARDREAAEAIAASAARHRVPFLDARRFESFGGDPALYYDGIHVREENDRRILDALLAKEPSLALP